MASILLLKLIFRQQSYKSFKKDKRVSSNQILARIVRSMQAVLWVVVAPASIESMSLVVAAVISVILSAKELN